MKTYYILLTDGISSSYGISDPQIDYEAMKLLGKHDRNDFLVNLQ